MADLKVLNAQKRDTSGKGFNRRLRQEGVIPGVFYTGQGGNISVQMPAAPLNKLFGEVGRTTVFNLEIAEGGKTSLQDRKSVV